MEEFTKNSPWKPGKEASETLGAMIEQFSGCQPVTSEVKVLVNPKIRCCLSFFFFQLQTYYYLHYVRYLQYNLLTPLIL